MNNEVFETIIYLVRRVQELETKSHELTLRLMEQQAKARVEDAHEQPERCQAEIEVWRQRAKKLYLFHYGSVTNDMYDWDRVDVGMPDV